MWYNKRASPMDWQKKDNDSTPIHHSQHHHYPPGGEPGAMLVNYRMN